MIFINYFLLILTFFGDAFAEIPSEIALYNKANGFYRDEKYSEALHIYEILLDSGEQDPDILYNASNAAYRSGSLWKAVIYLERYLKLRPYDWDAVSNLKFINSIKSDGESEQNIIHILYSFIPLSAFKLWTGVLFAVWVSLFSLGLLFKSFLRQLFLFMTIPFLLLFAAVSGFTINKYLQSDVAHAVIKVPETSAYSGPGERNTIIFNIYEGTKVKIERIQDFWYLIRLRSGAAGWVFGEDIEKI